MKRLLVIFHIYYHNQVDWFIEKMKNINGCEWKLITTFSSENHDTMTKLKNFKPDVKFIRIDNIGYDVWPFIKVIQKENPNDYDYVLKLHTKGALPENDKINKVSVRGWCWRNMLVDSLLKSRTRFKRCLDIICNEDIGMVCCYEMLKRTDRHLPEDTYLLEKEAAKIGIDLTVRNFCAGTMFLVKFMALKKIAEADMDPREWEGATHSQSTGSSAHVYERLLSMAVYDAGYSIKGITASWMTGLRSHIYKFRKR